MKYSELINKFLNEEKNLFFDKISGIIYSQLRFFLFRKIQSDLLKTKNKTSTKTKLTIKFLLLELISILLLFIKLPFFVFYKNKVLYAEHGRYMKNKHKHIDPYTFLSQEKDMKHNNIIRIGTIKNSYLDLGISDFHNLFISVYFVHLMSLIFFVIAFPLILLVFLRFYIKIRKNTFFIEYINILYFFKFSVVLGRNLFALLLFIIIRPKKIKVVDAYNFNSSFIVLGNLFKVDTFEFQHGMISKEHIAYNCNMCSNIKNIFLPKSLYMWGDSWSEFIPIVACNDIDGVTWTYEYFYNKYMKEKDICCEQDIDILFIGQPSIQKDIVEIVRYISEKYKNKIFYYKVHPKERKLKLPANIKVLDGDLYPLLLRSKIILGGFSTVLLEAKAMGINTVSFKSIVPIEYINVLEHFGIDLIEDKEDFNFNCVNKVNSNAINLNNIFKE